MSRRQLVLGTSIFILVLLNIVVFWRRFRDPLVARPGDPRNQSAQVVAWADKPILKLNHSSVEIADVVAQSSRGGCPDDPDIASTAFDRLSADEIGDLFSAVAGLLQCYEKSSPRELISYMKRRNEQVDPQRLARMKEQCVRDGFVTREQLNAISDPEFVAKSWHWLKCDSHWEAVVENTGCVFLWHCHDSKETVDHPLAPSTHKVFQNIGNYAHVFRPDIDFKESCKQPEGVLMADIQVVIEHDETLNKERSPYFVRFWYSNHDKLWHPMSLSHVSTTRRGPESIVKIIF